MKRNTKIGWIRHGMTEWNALGKIQGTTDIPLSAVGIRQAELLANRLAAEGATWNGVVSSDLQRAATTGETIARRLGISHLLDSRLRERAFGMAEGTTEAERLALWGADWRRLVPDQETDETMLERGRHFLSDWMLRHEGEAWLFVTHGSFLGKMLQSLCRNLKEGHLGNVSLTILETDGHNWVPLLHNCTAHLQET